MRLGYVSHVVGQVLRWYAAVFLLPLLLAWIHGNLYASFGFLLAGGAALGLGQFLVALCGPPPELRRMEAVAVVAAVWLLGATIGAVPFVWYEMAPVDALFESMSAFTTTGATAIKDFSAYGPAIYFWRALAHWIGGLGVIALLIAVLPRLAIAGSQMFFAEAAGPSDEKLTPRIRHTAIALWSLYAGLTAVFIVLLLFTGMPLFDAVCNAFGGISTGGLSPHAFSIGGYGNPAAEWVFIVFMFLGGTNFLLQYRILKGRPGALFRDEEFRAYLGIVIAATGLLWLSLSAASRSPPAGYLNASTQLGVLVDAGPFELLRHALFQTVSIVTTTGFVTDDFALWDDRSRAILFVLMFIGGCAGSTSGGPKIVRLLLLFRYVRTEIFRSIHPTAIRPVRLNGRTVPAAVLQAIVVFLLLYLLLYAISVALLVAFGTDLMTALAVGIATLGNIGAALGAAGPMAGVADMPAASKIVLTLNMWIGRLEVMTVLLLLVPEVWRGTSWRGVQRAAPEESSRSEPA